MREIVMDTETTGLDPMTGDRIVEIGAVELINHLPTDNTFHRYLNPQRDMPAEAFAVHGLSAEFLADKPLFADVVDEFMAFVGNDAPLIIHNASFDMKFLNAELARIKRPQLPDARALDTLLLARRKFPGAPSSLDALCRRFGIDNSGRDLHGALLDSRLLAEVYLELIGGRQPDLVLVPAETRKSRETTGPTPAQGNAVLPRGKRPVPLAPRLTEAEAEAHRAFVEGLGPDAIWLKYVDQSGQ
ncbi:DNA polymerase III subunit epsilon [Paracoccus pacificus]|uniref:DNA polymerase III subunit epsilon n=1 Tax=Paracoccus pacificus TaxID=1463598 RepID=A0ABW4R2Y0_9RHOB